MWQSVIIILIGVLLALTGWSIGRLFSARPLAANGRNRDGVTRFEWLIEDNPPGQELARSSWFSTFIYNFNHVVRFKRVARRIVAQSSRLASRPAPSLRIVVRSIGQWTFSSGLKDWSRKIGPGEHPGTEFLKPGQMVLQVAPVAGGDGVRPEDADAPDDNLKLIHHDAAERGGTLSVRSYALQSFLLSGHDRDDETDRLLGAHMTALLASPFPERYPDLIQVASEILGLGAHYLDKKSLATREIDTRAQFESHYLTAWITGALGQQDCDPQLLFEALGNFKLLLAPGVDAHCGCSGLEGALVAANGAQLAMSAYELSGRNPERLLEADEYCARARSRLDQELYPELFMDIELLEVRIRRSLAVHDRSLPGLLAATDLLGKVDAATATASKGIITQGAALALEEGRLLQARAAMSGDIALRREAMRAYSRVHVILNSEQGGQQSLMRDAVLGLAQCLISVGQIEGCDKPFRKAIKIIDDTLPAGPAIAAGGGKPKSRASHVLEAKLSLLKGEALEALAQHSGEVEHIETALLLLQKITQELVIQLPFSIAKRSQFILTRLLLDRAEMTGLTLHYKQAVDAIRAKREELGLTSAPTANRDGVQVSWRLELGYARALSMLAERTASTTAICAAEVQAWKLRDRAISEGDDLHNALAEQMLGRILAQKSDAVPGGDIGTLADAINAMRRALEFTPRVEMPLAWGARQSALGGLLAKYGMASGGVEGLEAAVSAYEKSLDADMGELDKGARATTLIDLGETLNLLSRRSGDKNYKDGAEAAFQHALDVGSFHNLHLQAERAEAALSRLRG